MEIHLDPSDSLPLVVLLIIDPLAQTILTYRLLHLLLYIGDSYYHPEVLHLCTSLRAYTPW